MDIGKRAVGIIIRDNRILLLRRFWQNQHYYVFPGGGVEKGEDLIEACKRELREELNIEATPGKELFSHINHHYQTRNDHYFWIDDYIGEPENGEIDRFTQDDQTFLEWVQIDKLDDLANLNPPLGKEMLIKYLKSNKCLK